MPGKKRPPQIWSRKFTPNKTLQTTKYQQQSKYHALQIQDIAHDILMIMFTSIWAFYISWNFCRLIVQEILNGGLDIDDKLYSLDPTIKETRALGGHLLSRHKWRF